MLCNPCAELGAFLSRHTSLIAERHGLVLHGLRFDLRCVSPEIADRFTLTAADAVLIPVQCEYLALEGISQLTDTLDRVRQVLNPALAIEGVVMTMYDDRTNLSRQVVDEVRSVFGDLVYKTVVPRNIRLAEAPSHGKPIFLYDIRSRGAEAYLSLAKEFVENEKKSAGQGA